MRTLPSESIDLIYIDPPFFSNRVYNVIWGDQNEERSFSDIWEGGLDGYLIWLNARLYEMKRILKQTGSIYVHCDWHASHYIKVEMDKIFGYENLISEIIWAYGTASGGRAAGKKPVKGHEVILVYSSNYGQHIYNKSYTPYSEKYIRERFCYTDEKGRVYRTRKRSGVITRQYLDESPGVPLSSVWSDIKQIYAHHLAKRKKEEIGYPTQKPEILIERILQASSNPNDLVLDVFVGGGTTAAVAQRLGRRWIACDQSRVAIAVTAERLKAPLTTELDVPETPDFTIEHWGVYESEHLETMPPEEFRSFILACYDARPSNDDGIHAYKGNNARIPVWVGPQDPTKRVTASDVNHFAQAIARLPRYGGDEGLRNGIMLAWGFREDAQKAAEELREREALTIAFVRIEQIRIDSPKFREHIARQSTDRGDYSEFLTFVRPPLVSFTSRRLKHCHYGFDASDSHTTNTDSKIINVQWDFNYNGKTFHAESGKWFQHTKRKSTGPLLQTQHTFPKTGIYRVGCKIQDDKGGEGEHYETISVE